MQFTCTFVPLFLFWRRYAEFFLIRAVDEAALKDWHVPFSWIAVVITLGKGSHPYKIIVRVGYGNRLKITCRIAHGHRRSMVWMVGPRWAWIFARR